MNLWRAIQGQLQKRENETKRLALSKMSVDLENLKKEMGG